MPVPIGVAQSVEAEPVRLGTRRHAEGPTQTPVAVIRVPMLSEKEGRVVACLAPKWGGARQAGL